MYRHVSHVTVRDVDGWNEVLAIVAALNAEVDPLGLPTATVWTETLGEYNQLHIVTDYVSLAGFEEAQRKAAALPIYADLSRRLTSVVEPNGYTELFERAHTIGGQPGS
jgi:hypothetical protein